MKLAHGETLHVGCVGEYLWLDELDHDVWIHGDLVDKLGHENVVGIDAFEPGVEAVRDDGYEVYHEDAEAFDLDREFDTILAPQMLHHLANPGNAIERFEEHIKPDGRVVLAQPNHFFVERQLMYGLEARRGQLRTDRPEKHDGYTHHTASYRPSNLLELMSRYDWRLQTGYYVPGGSRPATLTGHVWHCGVLPALDRLLPDLFTKKTYVAVYQPPEAA